MQPRPPRVMPKRPILNALKNPQLAFSSGGPVGCYDDAACSPGVCIGGSWDPPVRGRCWNLTSAQQFPMVRSQTPMLRNPFPMVRSQTPMLRTAAPNPPHAIGDEWWEYSADLDAAGSGGGGQTIWERLMDVVPDGFTLAHTGDLQLHMYFGGIIGPVRAHVSANHNGGWYKCVFTFDDGVWSSQSCVGQPSVPGGAVQYQHPGYGYTTPQPDHLPGRNSIFGRLAARMMGRR